jgi:hypothetical protein
MQSAATNIFGTTHRSPAIAYRYINKQSTIHLAARPGPSSRDFTFYTRYIPQISKESNVLYGWVNTIPHASEIDESCNVIKCDIDTARIVADVIHIPLVVHIREYCNLEDQEHIIEVYLYMTRR